MITARGLTAEMAAINHMVNAMTDIHNEQVQRVDRDSSSDDDDFSDRRRSGDYIRIKENIQYTEFVFGYNS